MLNRRHIRTVVIQSVYSNSHELIKKKELKSYLKRTSSSTLDLFYCMIDYLKEIHLFFNNIESQKFSCPYITNNKYFFFFTKLNSIKFKRGQIINWDLNQNYIIEIKDKIIELNNIFLNTKKDDDESKLEFLIKCYSEIILESSLFYDFIEEQNINWVNDFPYVNTIGVEVGYRLIKHYEQNWVYNKWHREQHKICEELDVEPSNCVILGVDTKQLYPEYNRGGKTNRLCFSKSWDGRQGDTI